MGLTRTLVAVIGRIARFVGRTIIILIRPVRVFAVEIGYEIAVYVKLYETVCRYHKAAVALLVLAHRNVRYVDMVTVLLRTYVRIVILIHMSRVHAYVGPRLTVAIVLVRTTTQIPGVKHAARHHHAHADTW